MRRLLILFLLCASSAYAQNCTGSGTTWSCVAGSSAADIQSAITSGTDGMTITLAAGSYTFSLVKFNILKGTTIICATAPLSVGAATVNPCTINGIDRIFYADSFTPIVNPRFFRVSGITFDGGGPSNQAQLGVILFDSSNNNTYGTMMLSNVRVDHNTFQNYKGGSNMVGIGNAGTTSAFVYGVLDHNQLTNPTMMSIAYWQGASDIWAPGDASGTISNLFIEDNNLNFTAVGGSSVEGCTDGWGSDSFVARHNTSKNCLWTSHGVTHGLGPYNYEFYSNTVNFDSNAGLTEVNCYRGFHTQGANQNIFALNAFNCASYATTGTINLGSPNTLTVASATGAAAGGNVLVNGAGPAFANLSANITGVSGNVLTIDGIGASTAVTNTGTTIYGVKAAEIISLIDYLATPGGGDYILPQANGFSIAPFSSYIPNGNRLPQSTYRGYPYYSQLGRDAATQKLKPIYGFGNYFGDNNKVVPIYFNGSGGYGNNHVQANRDYYDAMGTGATQTSASSPFDGTVGTGIGTLANRPTTCTTNANEAGGGVGYFATDQGTQGILYRCSATNTWTAHWKPYIYPHPLVAGSTIAAPPIANVQSGGWQNSQTFTLTSATASATICYTTDKSYPQTDANGNCTGSTTTYTVPITVSSSTLLNAVATKAGIVDSPDSFYVYRIGETPLAPMLATPGQYAGTGTSKTGIYFFNPFMHACYTSDGTDPTATAWTGVCTHGSTGPTGAPAIVTFPSSGTTTVKALLTGVGFGVGPIASATYTTSGTNGLIFDGPFQKSTIDFGNQAAGTTSQEYSIVLRNSVSSAGSGSTTSTVVSAYSITGTAFADSGGGSCGPLPITLVATYGSTMECFINVKFTPPSAGTFTETLSVTSTAGNSPQIVTLTGVGTGGTANVDINPQVGVSFSNVVQNTTSGAQTVTLCNGTFAGNVCNAASAALTITSITLTGNPNCPGVNCPFTITSNACPGSLAAGSKCDIQVTANPTALSVPPSGLGAFTANLHVITSAASSPDDEPLSGTGIVAPTGTGTSPPGSLIGMLWNEGGVLMTRACISCGSLCYSCPLPLGAKVPKIIFH